LPVALDANGQARLTAPAAGVHRLTVTATDGGASTTRDSVYTAPEADAEFKGPFDLVGRAEDDHFAYYQLLVRPAGAGDDAWRELRRSYTPVSDGVLGRVGTTTLANGLYRFALRVVDVNGQATLAGVTVTVLGDFKLGLFQVAFEDLAIDAAGLPVRVVRSYDSLQRQTSGDFGWGWSVDYQSTSLRKNMTFGLAWEITNIFTQFKLCLRRAGQRKIVVTPPDGRIATCPCRPRAS
jgi:hypothetical protein